MRRTGDSLRVPNLDRPLTTTDLPAAPVAAPRMQLLDWYRARSTPARVALLGAALLSLAAVLAYFDVAGQVMLWEHLHWTVVAILATVLALLGARQATGLERTVRQWFAASAAVYLVGQIAWNLQLLFGTASVPALSDLFFLGSTIPAAVAFALSIRGRLGPGNELAVYLDTLAVSAATGTALAATYGPAFLEAQPLTAAVVLLYPVAFLTVAAMGLVTGLATRTQPGVGGTYVISLAFLVLALAWVQWLSQATVALPPPGSAVNFAFTFAILLAGWGFATWSPRAAERPSVAAASRYLGTGASYLSVAAVVIMLLFGEQLFPEVSEPLVHFGASILIVLVVARQAALLRERDDALQRELSLLEQERGYREDAQTALIAQRESQARYRAVVDVFGRLAEQITFAVEERDLVRSGMAALGQIVPTRHGDILLANPSQDRLMVVAAWGWQPLEAGTPAPVDSPLRCPGIRRGTIHSLENAADVLQLACPAHPSRSGSVLCVPMLALGQVVGVIHLGRPGIASFTPDDQRQATRVSEQVALAVSNLRLARSMEGMAMSDVLTGLHNARFFDPFVERELSVVAREGEPMGVLMIDIDHFKDFNDRYGHPAGDDALRAFARVLRATLRDSDTIARYGGEEFVVALHGTDTEAAAAVAEKVRMAVEQMVVDLGPGRYARLTISVGVASTDMHGTDRRVLLKLADQALYMAKQSGRNRVSVAPEPYRGGERRQPATKPKRSRGAASPGKRTTAASSASSGRGRQRARPAKVTRARLPGRD